MRNHHPFPTQDFVTLLMRRFLDEADAVRVAAADGAKALFECYPPENHDKIWAQLALKLAPLAAGPHEGASTVSFSTLESVEPDHMSVSRKTHPPFERPRGEMITSRWDPQLSTELW